MSTKIAFQDLFAEILADIDIQDSTFNEYLDSLCLNIILKNLDIHHRKEFIENIINSLEKEQILGYLRDNIPNFESKLRDAIVEDLKVSLSGNELNYE